jgi:GDP/UDP-N,N'-diacetylbacillosamine 2-epimerase (hydrolysing)
MSKKICVVTGSRADYGLLRPVLREISAATDLKLQVIATGMHLAPEFSLTFREIEADGFVIDRKVEMQLSSDSPSAITKSMGLGMIGFSDALQELSPDLLLVLGDRFEIFPAVAAALIACVPVAHLHGGETTEGAFDEAIRHSITKMSHLHFVAAEEYRQRVIRMGEHPDRVFRVGGLGVDNIRQLKLLGRAELEKSLGFSLGKKNLLVTFHPVTLEPDSTARQMEELLAALASLTDTTLLFTMPNADTEGRRLMSMIEAFAASHPNAYVFASMGVVRYLSCMQWVDGVVGNSSSGLAEAPSFRVGTVNIGDRQRGRLKAASVIDCEPERAQISAAIRRLYAPDFRALLPQVVNPYGDGGASPKIIEAIRACSLESLLKKTFYDPS